MAERRPPDPDVPSDDELLAWAQEGRQLLDATDQAHLDHLWDGIAATAFDEPAHATETSPEATAEAPTPPVDLSRERERRRPAWLGLVAAAAALVVAVGGVVWTTVRGPDTVPLATFHMEALRPDAPAAVSGRIVARDGQRRVDLDLTDLPASEDAFYELWLLDLEEGQLLSLGPVGDTGSYVVPAAVDLGTYPTIDVSVEPTDGDPTHSGDSILRGPITVAAPTS